MSDKPDNKMPDCPRCGHDELIQVNSLDVSCLFCGSIYSDIILNREQAELERDINICPECNNPTELDHNSAQCHVCEKLWPLI